MAHRLPKLAVHLHASSSNLAPRNPSHSPPQIDPVQLFGPGGKRCVAALSHVRNNASGHALCFGVPLNTRCEKLSFQRRCKPQDAHQSTILFKGYSTIPCAFAAFSRGKILRTADSSMLVC